MQTVSCTLCGGGYPIHLLRAAFLGYTKHCELTQSQRRTPAMPVIRISRGQEDKVWRTLVASGPISRISQEPIYIVSDDQIRLLRRKKLPFEVVPPPDGHSSKPKA
jgi:hypothetical protein